MSIPDWRRSLLLHGTCTRCYCVQYTCTVRNAVGCYYAHGSKKRRTFPGVSPKVRLILLVQVKWPTLTMPFAFRTPSLSMYQFLQFWHQVLRTAGKLDFKTFVPNESFRVSVHWNFESTRATLWSASLSLFLLSLSLLLCMSTDLQEELCFHLLLIKWIRPLPPLLLPFFLPLLLIPINLSIIHRHIGEVWHTMHKLLPSTYGSTLLRCTHSVQVCWLNTQVHYLVLQVGTVKPRYNYKSCYGYQNPTIST